MKTKLIILGLALAGTCLFSQGNRPPGPQPCEDFPARIDSMSYLKWNSGSNAWDPDFIRHYQYSADKLSGLLLLNHSSRDSVWIWYYHYDSNNNKVYDVLYNWNTGTKSITQKKEASFNQENQIVEERISNWRNNNWLLNTVTTFEYSQSRLSKAIVRRYNASGIVADEYSENYIYQGGSLLRVFRLRASDGAMTRYNDYFYNSKSQLSEVILYVLSGDQINPVFIPQSRRLYSYDVFELQREVIFESWIEGQWVITDKQVNFRRIDNATRVRICLNGRNLCVARQAVPGLLTAGGVLGACPGTSVTTSTTRTQSTTSSTANLKSFENVKVYPNPASESMTVVAGDNFSRVELLNSNGQTIRSFSLANSDQTIIERNGLPSGVYFLRFVGQDEVKTEKVIFR